LRRLRSMGFFVLLAAVATFLPRPAIYIKVIDIIHIR
jgi:hypothetical protein